MITFLQQVLEDIKNKYPNISELTLILPSKRAGGFLKKELKTNITRTQFAPKIISIEEFIAEISELTIIDSTELLFKSYETYLNTSSILEKDSFETYSGWATTLLNDFNEIDRYLVDQSVFFDYLKSIKSLERWGVQDEQSQLMTEYLKFWESLPELYYNLYSKLLKEKAAYQGMAFREAFLKVETYIERNEDQVYIFIGFNAINTSEQKIIQALLLAGNSDIYWDTDAHFYEDNKHSASNFIRKYHQEWTYFKNNHPKFIADNYKNKKNIKIVQAQKNVAQAKYVGEQLSKLTEEQLNQTAVILGDESLLTPLLSSLPENVKQINITMGVPLKNFPATVFFELLLNLHLTESETLYYKDILGILNHPVCATLIPNYHQIAKKLTTDNITHLSANSLLNLVEGQEKNILKLLFLSWNENSYTAVENCLKAILILQKDSKKDSIKHTVFFQLYSIFEKIQTLNKKYPHLKSIKTVSRIFSELIAITSLDFEGDAFQGLQVMGVLETRVLDFENVIITSVNEGVFPSGKSNASFITYDLKQEFSLPVFTDKDAIYTYHFYRLLHRAKNITLIYNSYSEGINSGEKSRFIRQLEVDNFENHDFKKIHLSPKISIEQRERQEINKTEKAILRIRELAESGFSPSALTGYIRNPVDFYFQKILNLNEFEEVEETVAANTLGTIIHDTLEAFYKPLEGNVLYASHLKDMLARISEEVTTQFKNTFKGGTVDKGKNLIIFEVAKRYIKNFLVRELAEVESGNEIKIMQIETKLSIQLEIPELDFPVKIHGLVDRIDSYNGHLRIIDYKTGKVEQRDLGIENWQDITQDYKYSKAFQVLAYAMMMNQQIPLQNMEAGIISFKNLSAGFLKFATKIPGTRSKDNTIRTETLESFKTELKKLIMEICDPNIPFIEKDIK